LGRCRWFGTPCAFHEEIRAARGTAGMSAGRTRHRADRLRQPTLPLSPGARRAKRERTAGQHAALRPQIKI